MKLQTEIFLWIGALIVAAGIISIGAIEWSTSQAISKIEPIFTDEVKSISKEEKRAILQLIQEHKEKKSEETRSDPKELTGVLDLNGKKVHYSFNQEELEKHPIVNFVVTHEKAWDKYAKHVTLELSRLKRDLNLTGVGVSLFVLICMLWVLRLIAKRLSKPITLLADAMQEVVKGRYPKVDTLSINERIVELHSLVEGFRGMVQSLKDREKIRSVLDKVVSNEIAEKILQGEVTLGGEVKVVTILFADIRNFTKMTQHMPPKDVIKMLNRFMTHMTDVIHRYGGVIDKYIGDEIMALFGAPVEDPHQALKGVQAGLAMQKELANLNINHEQDGFPLINMGVGIHTGSVVIGNMGAESRLNYTAIGATVNLAARLCASAQSGEVLISDTLLNKPSVKERVSTNPGQLKEFKGFSDKVLTYSVQGNRS